MQMPRRNIATFGTTNIDYYLLSRSKKITRIREGKVVSHRPEIIKPSDISELFEGFDDSGEKYADELFDMFGRNTKMLNYKFKNLLNTTTETASPVKEVVEKIEKKISDNEDLSAIIKGSEKTWQISIMKFIVEMTLKSAGSNISDLEDRGFFPDETGIPGYIRNRIEYLFRTGRNNRFKREQLGKILNEYKLFKEYEDRYFALFK